MKLTLSEPLGVLGLIRLVRLGIEHFGSCSMNGCVSPTVCLRDIEAIASDVFENSLRNINFLRKLTSSAIERVLVFLKSTAR